MVIFSLFWGKRTAPYILTKMSASFFSLATDGDGDVGRGNEFALDEPIL